jgi:hypothetical protein
MDRRSFFVRDAPIRWRHSMAVRALCFALDLYGLPIGPDGSSIPHAA